MTLNRFLKYINILIGILVFVALGIGYWVFYRPLPKTSGNLTAPIDSEASIVRDELGIPHITAASEEDAMFLHGFATAQDRMFQMDMARRKANGELAEVLGNAALTSDTASRTVGIARAAARHARNLTPEERSALAAYARGVNFYLEKNSSRLPVEFRLINYSPRPWTVADSIAIGLQMSATLNESWQEDVQKGNFRQNGDPAKVERLYPLHSGLESVPGSNAWALSGDLTASGKPLLASDPHLDFAVPSVWHQVHIQSPTLSVAGATLVGLPGVMIGHNDRIAWGVTNLRFDVQDIYAERLDPASGRYRHHDRLLQAERRQETIRINGASDVVLAVTSTLHGPIVVSQGAVQLALRWTSRERGGFRYPFLAINRASNWEEFREALSGFAGPPQNFVYADVDGNIGYQAAGNMPLRRYDGSVPVDGSTGEFEWQGYIPFENLPTAHNPESGMIVSANQNPFPTEYPHPVSGEFPPGYRERRIRKLLSAKTGWEPADFVAVQTDIYDPMLHSLSAHAVRAFEDRGISSGDLATATRLLQEWDGLMEAEKAAPLVASLLYGHLLREVAEKAGEGGGQVYDHNMGPAVVAQLLDERPGEWFSNYDQLLLRSLVDAIEEGKRMQGADLENWRWGEYNRLQLSAGVVERIPFIGGYFKLEPIPLSGSSHTVKQTTSTLGPSLRFIMDTGEWDRSLAVVPPGESGHVRSKHFQDQAKTYWNGETNSFPYQRISGDSRLEILPER